MQRLLIREGVGVQNFRLNNEHSVLTANEATFHRGTRIAAS